jgi:K(+)-stimulated pyrophosphate-energized sodium pump
MHPLFWLTPIGSVLCLFFAWYLSKTTKRFDEGTEIMREIAQAVRQGAKAYIKRQYSVVTIFFLIVFVILLVISLNKMLPIFVPFAFISGGFFSGFSGFIGMT